MKHCIVVATNRSAFWQRFCDALSKNSVEDLEVIFVGPAGPIDGSLSVPTRFIHIADPAVGAAQCWEIGARAVDGELLGLMADDLVYTSGFLDAVHAAASELHNPYDTFTARYFHNNLDETAGQRMWSVPGMPLLPLGGFSFTEDYHRLGGIDKRFHGVFWDTDLYQHMYELGGRTTLLDQHTCDEQNGSHWLYSQNEIEDGQVLRQLWPVPITPEMKRASARLSWE